MDDEGLIKKDKLYEKYITTDSRWRIASILLSLVTTIAVPILLFIAYMNDHNFFSYDFFIEGVFGMKIFFITTVLLLLVGAFILWFIPLVVLGRKNVVIASKIWGDNKFFFMILGGCTLFLWFVIGLSIHNAFTETEIDSDKLANLIFGLTIMFFLAVHLLTFLYSAKHQVISSIVLLIITIASVLMIPKQVSIQINSGLKAFGVGGNLPVVIKVNNSEKTIEGNLKLITPKNIYYSPKGNDNVTATYPIANIFYEVHTKLKE